MRSPRQFSFCAALAATAALLAFAAGALAMEYKIPPQTKCAECGMGINPKSPYVCLAVTKSGRFLYFDEPGEMLVHIQKMTDIKDVRVRDFSTGQWVDGRAAYYVKSKEFKTPMGWGIAAFASLKDARAKGNALPWSGAFSLLSDN